MKKIHVSRTLAMFHASLTKGLSHVE